MPDKPENPMFGIKFAGSGFEDLYPYELTLEEGFSKVYKGSLTLLSGKVHNQEALRGLVDKRVSLSISQRLGDERTVRTRFFHGVVTGAEGHGVFLGTDKQACYLYRITLEPAFARLAHTCETETFYRLNPVEACRQILDRYGLTPFIDQNYLDLRKYGEHLIFNRFGEPALSFISALLARYGLSFTFRHPGVSSSQLGAEELYFTDGFRFPVSELRYSDKRSVPPVGQYDFLSQDEGKSLWKMDTWAMEERAGFDGLEQTASYPDGSKGNYEWRRGLTDQKDHFYRYRGLWTDYTKEADHTEVDGDVKLILDARWEAMKLGKVSWSCGAANLGLLPGAIFELQHLYGMGEREVLSALVTRVYLHARTVWPPKLAVIPQIHAEGELVEVKADCIDWGKNSDKRYCP